MFVCTVLGHHFGVMFWVHWGLQHILGTGDGEVSTHDSPAVLFLFVQRPLSLCCRYGSRMSFIPVGIRYMYIAIAIALLDMAIQRY